eukprot:m.242365 g.242365  ORF g.242365 m.242365 type:complete len:181 (-) comp14022_c0_seq1:384-926(-)
MANSSARLQASTHRTQQHLAEAEGHGQRVLELLHGQDAQLRRIESSRQNIETSLAVSEHQLTIMESFKSFLFGSKPPPSSTPSQQKDSANPGKPAEFSQDFHEADTWEMVEDDSAAATADAGSDEVDEIRQRVRRLHKIASSIGNELDNQNAMLEELSMRTDLTDKRLGDVAARTNKLLK